MIMDVDVAVQSVLSGKREDYRPLVEAFEAPVRMVLGAILPDSSAVDDLVHEVFFTAFLKLREYQVGTNFRAWVKTIARNLALNERRRWLKQVELGAELAIEETTSPFLDQFTALVDGETVGHVRDCVASLGEAARAVVQRYYFDGTSVDEIARSERRKTSWVHLVLFRAPGDRNVS